MRLEDKKERRLTDLEKGHAAMWASWRPAANKPWRGVGPWSVRRRWSGPGRTRMTVQW